MRLLDLAACGLEHGAGRVCRAQQLRDLYGDVGYTIIDDVLSLPERMPNIYRRLTS